ncbi:unnamed protein product [Ranitomeya imitator]|uniref:Methyltransferase type 12 domain-containing protein n=1 Tax=Ranitomeya imitator TaxID=111125 RepID=A0ABN9L7Z6_9NEOB|nr:unnamed protein product [Ranitomeya imitator]
MVDLHKAGMGYRTTGKQLGEKFANYHLDDLEEALEKVMLSDETKIEVFSINSTRCVWRKDEYNPKNTIPTLKHERPLLQPGCWMESDEELVSSEFPIARIKEAGQPVIVIIHHFSYACVPFEDTLQAPAKKEKKRLGSLTLQSRTHPAEPTPFVHSRDPALCVSSFRIYTSVLPKLLFRFSTSPASAERRQLRGEAPAIGLCIKGSCSARSHVCVSDTSTSGGGVFLHVIGLHFPGPDSCLQLIGPSLERSSSPQQQLPLPVPAWTGKGRSSVIGIWQSERLQSGVPAQCLWSEEQEAAAHKKVLENSSQPLPPEQQEEYENKASDYWDDFYTVHENRFFKDRQWLFTEFPELSSSYKSPSAMDGEQVVGRAHEKEDHPGSSATYRILEVGCGVGNTVFPILQTNNDPGLFVYCCDFSTAAVEIVKGNPNYDPSRCFAFVHDLSDESASYPIPDESLDAIVLIFVLSAILPSKMQDAITRLSKLLKPGGCILLRDYGRYDMAQLRFKKGRCLSENFYVRGDGTRVYFFTQDELGNLFTTAGLEKVQNTVDRRLQVNRGKQLTMYRVWIQCKYRKPNTEHAKGSGMADRLKKYAKEEPSDFGRTLRNNPSQAQRKGRPSDSNEEGEQEELTLKQASDQLMQAISLTRSSLTEKIQECTLRWAV